MSFTLIKDFKSQNQTKHIDVIHHHVCGLVEDRKLAIKWIKNSTMLANNLIKAFPIGPFKKNRDEWNLIG